MNCPHCGAEIPDENWGLFTEAEASPAIIPAIPLPRYGNVAPNDIIARLQRIEHMLNAGFLPGAVSGDQYFSGIDGGFLNPSPSAVDDTDDEPEAEAS